MDICVGSIAVKAENILFMYDLSNKNSGLEKQLAALQKMCKNKLLDFTVNEKRSSLIALDDGHLLFCSETIEKLTEQMRNKTITESFSFAAIDGIYVNMGRFDYAYDLRPKVKFIKKKLQEAQEKNQLIKITRRNKRGTALFFKKNDCVVICSVLMNDLLNLINHPEVEIVPPDIYNIWKDIEKD